MFYEKNVVQQYFPRTLAIFVLPLLFGIFNRGESSAARHFESSGNAATHANASSGERGEAFYRIKKIVLDAGHGGHDTGCIGQSSKEKDNALAITLAFGRLLEASFPQIEVIYTRKEDVFVNLIDRAQIANYAKADLFISIHCNSLAKRNQKVIGTETYVLGNHRIESNLEVAKRENASIFLEKDYKKTYGDIDPDSPAAEIMLSAWQAAYLENSILLADLIEKQVEKTGRASRGVKQAGFLVLRETAMPSVLVETGYLTNTEDEEILSSEEGRLYMAAVLFDAFSNYRNAVEGRKLAVNEKSMIAVKTLPKGDISSGKEPKPVDPLPKPAFAEPAKVLVKSPSKPDFKILLTTSPTRLNPKRDPLALVGNVVEKEADGKFHYFATGFSSKEEAQKAVSELRSLGFPKAAFVEK